MCNFEHSVKFCTRFVVLHNFTQNIDSCCFVARLFSLQIYALLSVNFQASKSASVKNMTNMRYGYNALLQICTPPTFSIFTWLHCCYYVIIAAQDNSSPFLFQMLSLYNSLMQKRPLLKTCKGSLAQVIIGLKSVTLIHAPLNGDVRQPWPYRSSKKSKKVISQSNYFCQYLLNIDKN